MNQNSILYYQEKIKRLNNIGVMISKEKDIDKLMLYLLDESLTLTSSDAGSIYFKKEIDHKDLLVFNCSLNRSKNVNYNGQSISIDDSSVSGLCTLTGEPIIINMNDDHKLINKEFDKESDYQTQNMISVPMKNEQNQVVGIFQIINKKDNDLIVDYNEEDIDVIMSLASQCAILIDRIRLQQKLERNISLSRTTLIRFLNNMKQAVSVIGDDILKEQEEFKELATSDELTGLLTRKEGIAYLKKQLELAGLNGMQMVIGFIDVNNLKYVNDHYGHGEGDKLIKSVVELIIKVAREDDFMFRYGGDEFILCVHNADLVKAGYMKKRIDIAFEELNNSSNKPYKISASFGFSEYNYQDQKSVEELIKIADKNMYIEKRKSKKLS